MKPEDMQYPPNPYTTDPGERIPRHDRAGSLLILKKSLGTFSLNGLPLFHFEWDCPECGRTCHEKRSKEPQGDGLLCEECIPCDHSDRDAHCCLLCGEELGEWDACRAETLFEGDR